MLWLVPSTPDVGTWTVSVWNVEAASLACLSMVRKPSTLRNVESVCALPTLAQTSPQSRCKRFFVWSLHGSSVSRSLLSLDQRTSLRAQDVLHAQRFRKNHRHEKELRLSAFPRSVLVLLWGPLPRGSRYLLYKKLELKAHIMVVGTQFVNNQVSGPSGLLRLQTKPQALASPE